jgi:hypothetical protein
LHWHFCQLQSRCAAFFFFADAEGQDKALVYLHAGNKAPEELARLLREFFRETVLPVLASGRPPNLQLYVGKRRRAVQLSIYMKQAGIANWLQGEGALAGDGDEGDAEEQPLLGVPAKVGQDLKCAESTASEYL